ncbi:MAG: ABC transporter permease [Bacteroidales bacterium]|jgi:ABC-type transport system involved in multi-copper enzyme maturation permease subunit|nr:ABC transporter permease [Bacteroidales bacterium]
MLKTIIYKEISDNIRNLRFTVGSLLVVIVSLICVIILTSHYKDEVTDYYQRIHEQNIAISEFAHENRLSGMVVPQIPPSKFHPVVLGIEQNTEIKNYNNNPLDTLFPPFDIIIIVSILMSLLAILFSYNAISGETEEGTLRLILSNPVPRILLLTGKWLGGIICICIPFIAAVLLISIYISISPVIQWSMYHWGCFALFVLASLLFISIFYLIGLCISGITKNSTISMLVSLFIWVLFILVIPNISPYFAAQLYKVPSVNSAEKEIKRIEGVERDQLGNRLEKEAMEKYLLQYHEEISLMEEMDEDEIMIYLEQNPALKKVYQQIQKEIDDIWNNANRIQGEKADRIRADITTRSEKQVAIAKNIAAISPYACFVYIATDITGTGLHKTKHDKQQASEYSTIIWDFIDKRIAEEKGKNPLFGYDSFLDLSNRPLFNYQEEPVRSKFAATRFYWLILVGFNVIFLVIAYINFRKYDVR